MFSRKLETQTYLMDNIHNKEVVRNWMMAVNAENWERAESLLHTDFFDKIADSPPGTTSQVNPLVIKSEVNPFLEFLRMLDFDKSLINQIDAVNAGNLENKAEVIATMKLNNSVITDRKVIDIIAENDRVWVSMVSIIQDPHRHGIQLFTTVKYWLKNGKIVKLFGEGRYLNSLIQFGRIIIQRNRKEEIEQYLNGLRNLGILPYPH
ncbi:MAG: hypothetical protein ACXAB7_04040 [Candidatus Kariarchaeaceae archaeon]|jgi:hypothetical protein